MRTKVNRAMRCDYATLVAIAAIFLSVAVIAGIIYSYEGRRDPGNDLGVLIAPNNRQLPSDL
jgi:hypothetical protein